MTTKDYIAIAVIIARESDHQAASGEPIIFADNLIHSLADYMATDNPRFDRDKFIKACEA